jgi:hypothetical protein
MHVLVRDCNFSGAHYTFYVEILIYLGLLTWVFYLWSLIMVLMSVFCLQFLFVLCYATCWFARGLCPSKGFFCGCSIDEKGLVKLHVFIFKCWIEICNVCRWTLKWQQVYFTCDIDAPCFIIIDHETCHGKFMCHGMLCINSVVWALVLWFVGQSALSCLWYYRLTFHWRGQ